MHFSSIRMHTFLFHFKIMIYSIQAGNDSMLGDRLNMGDKSSIKKSMIGSCCEIGDKVKINNCIIMDNVKIKDS